jgi:outer membrane protein assembly factor BamA
VVRSRAILGLAIGTVLVLFCACTYAPQQRFTLNELSVRGNDELDDEEITEKIASKETDRFLGLFPGVIYEYEVFNRFVLERDLQRIERLYRSRGFYEARARAARVVRSGSKVEVEIVVEEGQPVTIRRVDVHGLDTLPKQEAERLRAEVLSELPLGSHLEEEKYEQVAQVLATELGNAGYANARVKKAADVDLPRRAASVGYWADPGPRCDLGPVRFEGIGDLPEEQLRRILALEQGDEYSLEDLEDGERALLDLGVFSSVSVEADAKPTQTGPNGKMTVPLVVKVERSKLRGVRLGGGVQVDSIKSDVHLTAGWEDQNFLGGMRRFMVEVVPGAVIYPTRFPTFETPERLLPQGRTRVEFREPGFFEARTNALVKGTLGVAPSLLSSQRDRRAPILGYRDYRASAGAERVFGRFYGYLSQNLQINVPFAYVGRKDDALERVVIAYPALFGTFDLRDHPITPHSGFYAASEVQWAGIFGDAQDFRLLPEVRGYVPVTRRSTFAVRGTLGLLLARNYGQTVLPNARDGESGLQGSQEAVAAAWVRDIQLMFFRGFFAGGAGSNRGYAAREIGPHGVIPYYVPGQVSQGTEMACAPGSESESNAACDLPLGGFSLWELSAEWRYPILGALSGTIFSDAADVSPEELSFRFRPHLSVGLGLRYDTPVGPIRLDVGYRVPGAQAPESARDEGTPGELFGLPIAMSFGIGEAF